MLTKTIRMQCIQNTVINQTPVIRYRIPETQNGKTEWTSVTVWNPKHPEQYRPGRQARVTLQRVEKNQRIYHNQRGIQFLNNSTEQQLTLPGF